MADPGGGGPAGSAGQSGTSGGGFGGPTGAGIGPGETSSSYGGLGFDGGANERGPGENSKEDRGFFGSIMDEITNNPVPTALSALGMLTGVPAFGIMGLASRLGSAYGTPGTAMGPNFDTDGGPDRVQQVAPTLNPIEDMVGSEYVAYGGVGADQLRRQLFPYMNFNQPTQPGVSGLVGQYAGPGMGTGLMTGPFGMSNTQV